MLKFDIFRKRGKGWELIYKNAPYNNSRQAALGASYCQNIKVVGVRPSDCEALKIQVFRFKYVASLACGSGS